MNDLSGDIHLSQSALSRAVDRLERDGLVKRSMCADDRRGVFVCLTDQGRRLHEQALPTHRDVLKSAWGCRRAGSPRRARRRTGGRMTLFNPRTWE